MSSEVDGTSDVTLLSCVHGRDRRSQRAIAKRDLQAAIKYGTKEASIKDRWKYTFANIVYITDKTSRREITSFVQRVKVSKVTLEADALVQHEQLKASLQLQPNLSTSHTVVVTDMSGSMREADVESFRSRSDAVFATVALDFVGKHLDDGSSINGTDVLTLIEMRDTATTVLFREPITNVLFNKLVSLKNKARPYFHGNYLPALAAVTDALVLDEDTSSAIAVVFLSDGQPSDATSPYGLAFAIRECVRSWGEKFGQRLHVSTIGFGARYVDFCVLKDMAVVATDAGAHGSFTNTQLSAHGLSSTLTDLRSSLSATRTSLITTGLDSLSSGNQVLRQVARKVQFMTLTNDVLEDGKWDIYTTSVKKFQLNPTLTRRHGMHNWTPVAMAEGITGRAMRQSVFGEGAERIVYQFCQVQRSSTGVATVVPPMMVAKYSRYVMSNSKEEMHFHEVFCRTQRTAGKYAHRFNADVAKKANNVATITFLECSVYVLDGMSVLVETMLPQAQYKKWNGNNGYVQGQSQVKAPNVHKLLQSLGISQQLEPPPLARATTQSINKPTLDRIEEEDESSDSDCDDDVCPPNLTAPGAGQPRNNNVTIAVEDVPQAFSHFTYFKSRRKALVCDLQGVLNTKSTPPEFHLTDPVIHHRGHGKVRKYGRTDHGIGGMHRFFQTHECNRLCELLNLPKCTRDQHVS
ncbi:hypothetical protein H257_10250 [Aphanomyces astaci]|uniref:Alpha-type protein kinase domain-containing protein n=1 Tax=Aphanomyces astaci TaxID=112090 RepID=W4G8L9_APHAT|nr:hypothetical protein H257_10250 [Aphanomyces astaci]ETV75399.1 hypothetical protein H257_10250 [Aphanomyces astaci]|eukprot:XP_009835033.1 hypothetical protein H257_10250 [Aphanomyces astaci]